MPVIQRHDGVETDIADLAEYLFERSEAIARRFVEQADFTIKELAKTPGIGSPKPYRAKKLAGMRSWWVKGFPKHLILYKLVEGGILVVAIVHGARNIPRILRDRT